MIPSHTRNRSAAGLMLAAALALAAPVHAVEGGLGAYLLGSRDSLAGLAPPPGNYFTTDLVHMEGSVSFVSLGGAVLSSVTSTAWIAKLNFTHSIADKLGGGQPVLTVTLPVVLGELSSTARSAPASPASSSTTKPTSAT